MKIAIISDIHGNLEAIVQVLADIDQAEVDVTICLGDNIGYGPDPEAVVNLLTERGIISVMGNHELALAQPEFLEWFNVLARQSLALTRDRVTEATLSCCGRLPTSLTVAGARFVHGAPPDSPLTYIVELDEIELTETFEQMTENLCFVGHTHLLAAYGFDGKNLWHSALGPETLELGRDEKYIVNVGSVGQPRDRDKTAKYVIWDTHLRTVEARFVPYDANITVDKILTQGWPAAHAKRLR